MQAVKAAKPFRPFAQDEDDNVVTINQFNWREHITPGRLTAVFTAIALVMGFLYSSTVSGEWINVLKYLNKTAFGTADPIFNKDIGFFVFDLPFYQLIYRLLALAIIMNAFFVAIVYLVTDSARGGLTKIFRFEAARYHLSALAALFFLLKSWAIA
ncbi:hypothetical protein N752_13840 [Desulforamulus aquiferis]|nr:hypothetical protein N752_13840 [Desulforamulus aquiferis]